MTVTRGCGNRQKGAIYACCPLSPYGKPLEDFICDPPIPLDASSLGITPIGVKLIERKGVWHILDWVGSTHYANPADFVEEVRRYGMSRRLAQTLEFKKLTPQSRILLAHSRAYIHNYDEYQDTEPKQSGMVGFLPYHKCPKNLPEHTHPSMETMCARLWYQDVIEGEEAKDQPNIKRLVKREMPAFEYYGMSAPEGVTPVHKLAIFASFPITNLAVVRDTDGNTHEQSLALAEEARIPVELVDE
jgi:hypothetical protein